MTKTARDIVREPSRLLLPLFVPADRPDRYAKAATSGADFVILDLEDAVAPSAKDAARNAASEHYRDANARTLGPFIRMNSLWSGEAEADFAALAGLDVAGIILPKTESADDIAQLRARFSDAVALIALVETPRGLAEIRSIAAAADRVAFGSIDFAAALGIAHRPDTLAVARAEVVLAAALCDAAPPFDGVCEAMNDPEAIEADARRSSDHGFGGKLLIHPKQIVPTRAGFAPSSDEVDWAERVQAAVSDGGVATVDGAMVDRPVLLRAERILSRREPQAASG